jgi:predicted flap endonuclease-1-like 5' DNA nuclease
MKRVDNLNAPSLNGWLIAVGAGVVAFVIAKVVGGFDYTTSGFFAALITGVAGLVIGMPWGAADRIPKPDVDADVAHAAAPAAVAAPVAAPVAPMAEAAPLMAAPMVSSSVVAEPATPVAPKAPAAAPAPKAEAKPKAAAAPKAEAKPKTAAKPQAEPAPAAAPEGGSKPKALKAARKGVADDLKVIEGIGPAMEKLLNEGGIFHIDQIAAWGPAEVEWMDGNLKGFKGRVTRDKWVAQAKLIGEVGLEEFLRRAKTNDY